MSGPPLNPLVSTRPCAAWWGKLPSQGDFVGRRLPHAVITRWDEWMRNGMDQLRSDAGEDWATRFVQSPLWFFLCPAAITGQPMIGVLGPSVDRIGRLFPLAIMATTEDISGALAADEDIERFLTGARQVLIDARRLPLSPQQLDERLLTLRWPFHQSFRTTDQSLIDALLGDLDASSVEGNAARLPRMDWRTCMHPRSTSSVWWISPTPQHAHDEVIQHDVLHRRLFTRLFKGA